jgi:YHS domain-containing protein
MFFRTILYLVALILLLTILRYVIGWIGRGVSRIASGGARPRRGAPAGGRLSKDPVCGTYVADQTSVRAIVEGREYFFCSSACRDKFLEPPAA